MADTETSNGGKLPVVDWATDFDHTDPVWVDNPFPIWDDLRKRCPVAHSERFTGVYLPTRHEDIAAIAYDTENFSSRSVVVSNVPNEFRAQAPVGGAPPITSDPPFHQHARRLLLPAFGPKVIEQLRPACVMLCDRLLDEMGDRAVVDGAVDYAQNIPTAVIAQMLGLPIEDQDLFREFVHGVLGAVDAPVEERGAVFQKLVDYLKVHIDDHRANPREDLISFLLDAELFGEKLSDQHVFGTIILLLVAGIDTTWSAIGASIFHLASNTDDRNRLVREPELLPGAVEEFLRAYAPVTMARVVEKDVEIAGTTLTAGQWCLLPFPAANRDPEQFDRADEVIIDRAENRHSAFGLGIHRCIGSNLARLELTVALERWLARFPDFDLDDPSAVTWAPGQVRGPRILPIRLLERASVVGQR
jgi:cytochrome P450